MRLLSSCAALLCLTALTATANPVDPSFLPDPNQEAALDGDALTALFTDRTHRGYYQYADWDTSEPAFTEVMKADGTTVHTRDGQATEGTWRTLGNVVCFDYAELSGGCFNMYEKGNCYFAFSALSDTLVAITVLDGESADCEPSIA